MVTWRRWLRKARRFSSFSLDTGIERGSGGGSIGLQYSALQFAMCRYSVPLLASAACLLHNVATADLWLTLFFMLTTLVIIVEPDLVSYPSGLLSRAWGSGRTTRPWVDR